MGYEWIFDVLKDLKAFADANDMPELAAKSQEALTVAAAEVALLTKGTLENHSAAPTV
jgi:hypothetical protein